MSAASKSTSATPPTNSSPVLPQTGFLRIPQLLGNPKATPPIPAIFPISKSSWWAGVKSGKYPPPLKLGPRTTVWRVEDIRRFLESAQ